MKYKDTDKSLQMNYYNSKTKSGYICRLSINSMIYYLGKKNPKASKAEEENRKARLKELLKHDMIHDTISYLRS